MGSKTETINIKSEVLLKREIRNINQKRVKELKEIAQKIYTTPKQEEKCINI